jgi:hypothetical protein
MQSLGLFLDGKSVKIAAVSKVKNQLTLERLGEFDEIPYELLQGKNLHIVTALPAEDVVRRQVELKLTRHSAVLKALPFQLESLLPFSLEETVVHPFFYSDKEKTDVVVFATTRLALKKHLADFQEKNIDPDQVSCLPIALARFARLIFQQQSISWVHRSTALAMEGEKIIFSQSLEDKGRLETYLKTKYCHHFALPTDLPAFQNYSSEQLLAFAIPIGLALDGLHETPCQFRQNDFTSSKHLKKLRRLKQTVWASCLGLTVLAGSIGEWISHRRESALKNRIAAHFSCSGSLEEQLAAWQKQISQEGKEFPLLPNVPSARDVLSWLGTLQEPIDIVYFRYRLDQYPKAGDQTQPYLVKIDLEFTAESPAIAHRFQEALEKTPTFVDKKHKIVWTSQKDSYKLSFVLRKT